MPKATNGSATWQICTTMPCTRAACQMFQLLLARVKTWPLFAVSAHNPVCVAVAQCCTERGTVYCRDASERASRATSMWFPFNNSGCNLIFIKAEGSLQTKVFLFLGFSCIYPARSPRTAQNHAMASTRLCSVGAAQQSSARTSLRSGECPSTVAVPFPQLSSRTSVPSRVARGIMWRLGMPSKKNSVEGGLGPN